MPSSSLIVLASLDRRVPAAVAALAEDHRRATPAPVPVRARPAASVVVCRDGDGGLETYLLHRHARMAFAASMAVFPGGGLDDVDRSASDPLRACAVRETHEETGVELLPGDLLPWAHWVTPELQPIRYDTFFYVAGLPADQEAADVSGETERAAWTAPAAALAAYRSGRVALMPPTLSILLELAERTSVRDLLAYGRDRVVATVLPRVVRGAGGWEFVYPEPGEVR